MGGANVDARNEIGSTPLHLAASNGHSLAIEALLADGADINAGGVGEITPLHLAAQNGHAATIKALLIGGAPVNAKAKGGVTPLDLARWGMETTEGSIAPFQEAIEILKAHGAR